MIKLQNERLVKQVKHVFDDVPYTAIDGGGGRDARRIRSIDDCQAAFLCKDICGTLSFGLLG
jgi:hypothetical protein